MADPIVLSVPLLKEFRSVAGSREAIVLIQRKIGFRGMIDAEPNPLVPGSFIFHARGISAIGQTKSGSIIRKKVWGIGETAVLAADNLFKRLVGNNFVMFFNPREVQEIERIHLIRDARTSREDGPEIIMNQLTRDEMNLHPYYTETGAHFIP